MITYEGENSFYSGGMLRLLADDHECAWAEKFVRSDPDLGWVLGNYVEADNANDNGHIFPYDDLVTAQETVIHKPLNMLHQGKYIVGAFVGSEIVEPPDMEADGTKPVMEALSPFWRTTFREEYELLQKAHSEGAAFFSMEATPEEIGCVEEGCGLIAKYVGRHSDTYCEHLQVPTGKKMLIKPHFNAGALIVPPIRPGWKRADISQLSQLMEAEDKLLADLEEEFDHLGPDAWQSMMDMLVEEARDFSQEKREKLAKQKKAMPNRSFPIENATDLKNAIRLAGNAKDPAAAKAHIKRRAKALGLEKMIPDTW